MKSSICTMFGIEFPLIAFTHCRDVVVEVSKAGGMGVLGAAGHTTESLEIDLLWVDEHIGGNPYGVDLIAPTSMASATSLAPRPSPLPPRSFTTTFAPRFANSSACSLSNPPPAPVMTTTLSLNSLMAVS